MSFMKDIEDAMANLEASLGVKMSAIGFFAASVAGVAAVSTAIYWAVFGFGHWSNEMSVAQKIMLARANQPVVQQQAPQAAVPPLQAGQQAGQYVCATHGAVGLPRFTAAGVAVCPICGQPMQLRCLPTNAATPAAFAGG